VASWYSCTACPRGLSGPLARRLAAVSHETAIELNAGRAVPIGVRRAVRGLADELRKVLEPRQNSAPESFRG
jgi:hypothetical protein